MDDLGSSLKDVEYTKLFLTNLNRRPVNLPVNKHKIKDIFDSGVGFANVEHSDQIQKPPPPKPFTP